MMFLSFLVLASGKQFNVILIQVGDFVFDFNVKILFMEPQKPVFQVQGKK